MKKLLAITLTLLLLFGLCGCTHNDIPDIPDITEDTTVFGPGEEITVTTEAPKEVDLSDRTIMSELVGSFLTMEVYGMTSDELTGEYVRVFNSYAEIASYLSATEQYYMFGSKFLTALNGFDDIFLSEHDVMILRLEGNNIGTAYDNIRIRVEDASLFIGLERIAQSDAPEKPAAYHIIATAPKDAFYGLDTIPLTVEFTDIEPEIDESTAELYIYPDFVPYIYPADAIGVPSIVIDTIDSYDKLIGFHEKHKASFNLEEFRKQMGTIYTEELFEDFTLLAMIVPSSEEQPPKISDIFVYNGEIYITVDNPALAVVSETTPCHLMIAAVPNKDLESVNLKLLNISFD